VPDAVLGCIVGDVAGCDGILGAARTKAKGGDEGSGAEVWDCAARAGAGGGGGGSGTEMRSRAARMEARGGGGDARPGGTCCSSGGRTAWAMLEDECRKRGDAASRVGRGKKV